MKSIIQTDLSVCYLCGKHIGTDRDCHHVFEGTANRKKSEEDGMKVYLHHCCHMWLHEHPKTAKTLKQRAQRIWERTYGDREAFMKRFGQSYLLEDEDG